MVKKLKDDPIHPNRALQIWQILIAKASNRQTLTYGMLAKMMGYDPRAGVTVSQSLNLIKSFCLQNKLPVLTVLVVKPNTGLPGEDVTESGRDMNVEREEVFKHPWFEMFPPTPEEFRQAVHR